MLAIKNAGEALERLDGDEKRYRYFRYPWGETELPTISESGLYTIVLHGRDAAEIRLRAERRCHAALKRKNLDLYISTPYPCLI